MDRNQATGLILMSALFIIYFIFFAEQPPIVEQQPMTDSLAQVEPQKVDPVKEQQNAPDMGAAFPDSVLNQRFGVFSASMKGEAQDVVLENEVMKVTFNTKGGNVKQVLLKEYVTYEKEQLVLLDENSSFKKEEINTIYGFIDLNKLYYRPQVTDSTVTFSLLGADGLTLMQRTYKLEKGGYQVYYSAYVQPIEQFLRDQNLSFYWYDRMKLVEQDMQLSRQKTTINYFTINRDYDYLSETSTEQESAQLSDPAQWVSFKQKFFNASIITEAGLNNVTVKTDVDDADLNTVKVAEMQLSYPLSYLTEGNTANLRYYYGPNDYEICKAVADDFQNNVNLGWVVFKPINIYGIAPLFHFLERFTTNYGIIILVMVFLIKSLLFPLTYKSYVSSAKMRVLKPEMDEIKEKHGDNMQKVQQETMKLYTQVGANPLSGCIPVLAQMPIFLALFNFFPNAIELRQESFLWATDLSSYDSILDLPFSIPFYGDHVSLFTLLMTGTQLLLTYYNNQNTPATSAQAAQMKTIGYIMPVMFLFFLNSFSAGLTYYYFISNLITIGQTLIIRKMIDDTKIRKILDENKKRNQGKKKSGLAKRLEQAMKAQEEKTKQVQQARNNSKKNKK